jgi:hypothetical protein
VVDLDHQPGRRHDVVAPVEQRDQALNDLEETEHTHRDPGEDDPTRPGRDLKSGAAARGPRNLERWRCRS